MSALEQIHAYLMTSYEDWGEPHKARISPKVMAEAEELYEAVARELAERIRKHADDSKVKPHLLEGEWTGLRMGANVIDPKKEERE